MIKRLTVCGLLAALLLVPYALAGSDAPPVEGPFGGPVVEMMNSGGYVYLQIQHDDQKIWVATKACSAVVGDEVHVPASWAMKDFFSKTLDRKFEWIMFAPNVVVGESPAPGSAVVFPEGHPAVPGHPSVSNRPPEEGHPAIGAKTAPVVVEPGSVARAEGGFTVEECFSRRSELAGQGVSVRGIVVKVNPAILGVNWIHLRDGTGGPGSDDLLVTTAQELEIGTLIVAKGVVACDKDLGSGYFFPVLIENAEIAVESPPSG